MSLRLNIAGKTDVGLVRPGNEDYLHIDDKKHLYAICDGMGGHQAGEVASMSAAQVLSLAFNHFSDELLREKMLAPDRTVPTSGDLLIRSVRLANRRIYNKAFNDPSLSGMGTTIVAVTFDKEMMSVVHVGDSRAYRLDQRRLVPLTVDHSWVSEIQANQSISREEAESMVGKNVITRALGVREAVDVDYRLVRVRSGDIFVLCSDGLCGFAADDEIFDVAHQVRDNIDKIVDNLIRLANDRGGSDNVTVIAIEVQEAESSTLPEVDVFTQPAESAEVLSLEDQWLDKLAEAEKELESKPDQDSGGDSPNKLFLTLIFLVFIVVAGAVIYFTSAGR